MICPCTLTGTCRQGQSAGWGGSFPAQGRVKGRDSMSWEEGGSATPICLGSPSEIRIKVTGLGGRRSVFLITCVLFA